MEPFLTYSGRRDLRERVWRTYYSRGDNGDAKDNNETITEILALRAERSKLLGFDSYARWSLEDTMAKRRRWRLTCPSMMLFAPPQGAAQPGRRRLDT